MQVASLMTREVATCRPETTLAAAAVTMREKGVGFLPVVGGNQRLEGVLTDRDALMAVVAAGKAPMALPVSLAMRSPVTTCASDLGLDAALQLLAQARLHRLPVTDEAGRLVGVISIDDLARAAERKGDPAFQQTVALALSAIVRRRSVPDDED